MLRPMRYVGYAVAALLILMILLVAGTTLAVRIWGPQLARERVEAALSPRSGARFTWARRVEAWRGRLVVRE